MSSGLVLVYGGRGALGAECVSQFISKSWRVISIDLGKNDQATYNIVLDKDASLENQEKTVLTSLDAELKGEKLDSIICVAGGWAGGNASKDLIKNSDLMWKQSVWSSLISASVASMYLKESGLLVLTGAKAALSPTPGMIGYGMAKAAVHHLTKSLAEPSGGLPKGSTVLSILPVTLDTPMNRKWMPNGDFSTWTPLSFLTQKFADWSDKKDLPASGSLVQVVTTNSQTDLSIA